MKYTAPLPSITGDDASDPVAFALHRADTTLTTGPLFLELNRLEPKPSHCTNGVGVTLAVHDRVALTLPLTDNVPDTDTDADTVAVKLMVALPLLDTVTLSVTDPVGLVVHTGDTVSVEVTVTLLDVLALSVWVNVTLALLVGLDDTVPDAESDPVTVTVADNVTVALTVGDTVKVGLNVAVAEYVALTVAVSLLVTLDDGVPELVGDGVGVADGGAIAYITYFPFAAVFVPPM